MGRPRGRSTGTTWVGPRTAHSHSGGTSAATCRLSSEMSLRAWVPLTRGECFVVVYIGKSSRSRRRCSPDSFCFVGLRPRRCPGRGRSTHRGRQWKDMGDNDRLGHYPNWVLSRLYRLHFTSALQYNWKPEERVDCSLGTAMCGLIQATGVKYVE